MQNPLPDTTTRKGDTVLLTVSSGPVSVPMPDLRGTSYTDAVTRLQALNISRITVERVTSTEYAPDIIASHTPEAEAPLTREMEVTLYVSGGEIIVPSLEGLTLEEAEQRVKEINLTMSPVLQYVDTESEIEHGHVSAQSPEEDSRVMQNTAVTLLIYRCSYLNPYSEITVTVPESDRDQTVRIMMKPDGSAMEYEDATLTWTADAERSRKISVKRPDSRNYTCIVYVDGVETGRVPIENTD